MEGLTHEIDETVVDQLPLRLQRHTIRVPSGIGRLLCKIAHAMSFYHEHH